MDGAALPGASQAVLKVKVYLGAVECAVAGVQRVVGAHGLKRLLEASLGKGPVLARAHGVFGTGGKLDPVGKAKLLVVGGDQARGVDDLLTDLLGRDEEVGVILRERTHAKEAVQRPLELVAMVEAGLGELERQVTVAAWTTLVDETGAGAVHGLDGKVLVVYLGRVHVVLVVVPVTGGLPEGTREDDGRLHLLVAIVILHLLPIAHEGVLDTHAVGQPEGKARTSVARHEELHLPAYPAVIAPGGLGEQAFVLGQLLLVAEGGAIHAREHLVVLVALPVGARDARELEGLECLGVEDVRPHAHVNVLALPVEGDAGVLWQVVYVLDLVLLATLGHVGDSLLSWELVGLELEVLPHDLAHLGLDRGKVLLRELRALGQFDVIVEAVVGGGPIGEVGLGIQALDGLGQDVGGGVTDDVKLLILGDLVDVTVVEQCLHG